MATTYRPTAARPASPRAAVPVGRAGKHESGQPMAKIEYPVPAAFFPTASVPAQVSARPRRELSAVTRPRVVVLGGGFGGLETSFSLRSKLGEQAQITLVSDYDTFLFKPNTIYIPFGLEPKQLMIPLAKPLAKQGIQFVHGRAQGVDVAAQRVHVQQFEGRAERSLPYDYLVVATGASMRPAEVPGMPDYGVTIWTPAEMLRLRRSFDRLAEDGKDGVRRHVVFLVPPHNKCSGPLYELVQMLDTWLRRKHARAAIDITWSTYEAGYIQAFGPRLHEVVTQEFERRGIAGFTQYVVDRVEAGEVRYKNGQALPHDLLVTFPPYVAATAFPGLPSDERGFVATDLATRRVEGHPEIYAVGDAADFPVKQAFLALLQADAAAGQLAAEITGARCQAAFEPTSMCVMEQFDTATFAQVPLQLTGNPLRPVEVDGSKWEQYAVGSSPVWRAGKWLLGVYLPWRFGAGKPFHAELPWKGMEAGLRAMSAVFASTAPVPPAAPRLGGAGAPQALGRLA